VVLRVESSPTNTENEARPGITRRQRPMIGQHGLGGA
jgi:hypothetical protein